MRLLLSDVVDRRCGEDHGWNTRGSRIPEGKSLRLVLNLEPSSDTPGCEKRFFQDGIFRGLSDQTARVLFCWSYFCTGWWHPRKWAKIATATLFISYSAATFRWWPLQEIDELLAGGLTQQDEEDVLDELESIMSVSRSTPPLEPCVCERVGQPIVHNLTLCSLWQEDQWLLLLGRARL